MQPAETRFQLPLKDLLFKIDPDKAAKSELMPIHWKLYSDLLDRSNEDNIFSGSSISKHSEEIFNTLLEENIISQHPISYDYWSEEIVTNKKLAEPVKHEEVDSLTQFNDDIVSADMALSNPVEVDLDFLD